MAASKQKRPYTKVRAGDRAPLFTLPDESGAPVALRAFRGRRVILYFYAKDGTPGCTTQACDFRDLLPRLDGASVAVLGVSPDSVRSHARFKSKLALPFPLLSDAEHTVAEQYGVWARKQLFGHWYWANRRTTFVISATGRVERVWEDVEYRGHAAEVLAWLASAGQELDKAHNAQRRRRADSSRR